MREHSKESLSLTTFSGNLRTDWAGEVDCPWGLSQLRSPPHADELMRQCWSLITLSNRVRQDPEPDSWLWGHNFQGFRAPAPSRPWEHTESTYHSPAYKEVCVLWFAFCNHVWACCASQHRETSIPPGKSVWSAPWQSPFLSEAE